MATARLTQAWSPLRQAIASSSTSSSSATASSSSASALRCFSSSAASSYAAPIPPRSLPTSQAEAKTRPPRNPLEQAVQYPRHPLNAFFHFAQGPNEDSPAIPAAVIPDLDLGEKTASSRSWRAPELRRKSSMELHQLWYIMSMERNRLATKWDELKRVGAQTNARQVGESITSRMKQVRKSQARLKLVLNERRLALIEVQNIVRGDQAATEAQQASSAEEQMETIAASTDSGTDALAEAEKQERQSRQDAAYAALQEQSQAGGDVAQEFTMGSQRSEGREGVAVGQEQQQRTK